MGCCFGKCCDCLDPCCKRVGCSCKDHGSEGYMASIAKNRSCTDMPCIVVFAAFVLFLVSYVWSTAYSEGDPDRLIRGVNHAGKICGKSTGVEDLPYAFWPDPSQFRFKACTKDCNEATFTNALNNNIRINGGPGLYPSKLYMDKYCVPSLSNISISGFDDYSNKLQRSMGDLETAMPIIGASIGIAFVMSFFYIWLMKGCVGILVWCTIALIIAAGLILGYVLNDSSKDEDLEDDEAKLREYLGYTVWALTAIFGLIILFARDRIRIAIQVIKSAGRSIGDMPMMVFFPLLPLCSIIGFFFAWLYAAIYIFSAGTKTSNSTPDGFSTKTFAAESDKFVVGDTYEVIDYDDTIQNAFAPHFFLLLWCVQFGVYFTFTVIAGAVANWYFTPRGENGKKLRGNGENELSNRAVFSSCARTTRYHIGTILYASLIIAIIQFIRWCVRYLERTMNANGKEPNKLQKVLFRVVDCLLWCLECCLDKISRNALIWVAVYGDAFCPAVCSSFKLIWSNLMRVAVITFFSSIVTNLGKIMIPLMTMGVCGFILVEMDPYKTELQSPLLPLIVIGIISFAVAMLFLTVYDTAIDTVFVCFLIDEKQNKDSGKPMLADEGLRNIVQKYEAESKKLAASMQTATKTTVVTTHQPQEKADDAVAI